MEVCPAGFFCLDKNTLILVLVSLIILVVFYINKNNDKFHILEKSLDTNKQEIENKIVDYKSQINNLTNENINLERRHIIDKDQQRIYNPLMPPERSSPYRISSTGVAINIPTRGHSTGYQQVGALIQEDGSGNNQKILPLYGEQTYPGSRQWKYYTGSDGYQSIKLPVINNGKDCQDTYGCQEIYDGNVVNINGHDSGFKANIYKLDAPRYLPHVI
jgi:hypothetical protein